MPKRITPRWAIAASSPIKMDRDIAAELRQAANEVIPDALFTMEAFMKAFHGLVIRRWPVSPYATDTEGNLKYYRKSGNKIPSAERWVAYGSITPKGLIGSLGNPAPYTYMVKSYQHGLKKHESAYQQVVKRPGMEYSSKLAADIMKSIVKTITSDT